MLEKLFTVAFVFSMLNLTIHLYKLSLLGKLTLKKIVQETAGLSQSARKWTRIGTSMSGTLCLHGQQSLYANPTRLHLIKKLVLALSWSLGNFLIN